MKDHELVEKKKHKIQDGQISHHFKSSFFYIKNRLLKLFNQLNDCFYDFLNFITVSWVNVSRNHPCYALFFKKVKTSRRYFGEKSRLN